MPKLKKVNLYYSDKADDLNVVEFLQIAIGANRYQIEQILLLYKLNKKVFISYYNKRYKHNIVNLNMLNDKLDLRIE